MTEHYENIIPFPVNEHDFIFNLAKGEIFFILYYKGFDALSRKLILFQRNIFNHFSEIQKMAQILKLMDILVQAFTLPRFSFRK